jgi:subtilase family serine protease
VRRILSSLFVLAIASATLFGPAGVSAAGNEHDREACSHAIAPLTAHCDARVRTDTVGQAPTRRGPGPSRTPGASPNAIGNNGAYDPGNLRTAYNLGTGGGIGQTVAIVDAYDDPNAESDLSYYRSYFAIPACTTANGCFRKVNQAGVQGSYPAPDSGWSNEISLDLDMVSAICPNCHILLVEANSNAYSDLGAAENTAASLGATEISNSYGGGEFGAESAYAAPYNHPGIAITASAGDSGYGVEFPAASSYVTAVGGTTLLQSTSTARGWIETVWGGTGSGCSAYIAKPSWQTDRSCFRRTVGDVSAVADPNTGVWVYDTYQAGGWLVFGGTSVASPIVASVYALAGNARSITYGQYPYSHAASLNDVTQGSNGGCGNYLCRARAGYDGPTGLGTPNGTGAF